MFTYRLYGASDDCCEIEGDFVEEWYVDDLADDLSRTVTVGPDDGTGTVLLNVRYQYEDTGTWSVTPFTAEEHVDGLPELTMRYEIADNGYSMQLVIESREKLVFVPVLFDGEDDD